MTTDNKKWVDFFESQGWGPPVLVSTSVDIVYAVDQATQNPRSGNVLATYKTYFKYRVPNKLGVIVTIEKDSILGDVIIHDAKIEKMKFKESQ